MQSSLIPFPNVVRNCHCQLHMRADSTPFPQQLCAFTYDVGTAPPRTSPIVHLILRWAALRPHTYRRGGLSARMHWSSCRAPRQRRCPTTVHTVLALCKSWQAMDANAPPRERQAHPRRHAAPRPTSTTTTSCSTSRAQPVLTTATATRPRPTHHSSTRTHVQYRGPRRANGRTCCPWTCHGARGAARPATAADATRRRRTNQTTDAGATRRCSTTARRTSWAAWQAPAAAGYVSP